MFVVAGDLVPGARGGATTLGGATAGGGPIGAGVHLYGPTAIAVTDSGHRAFAGSGAMYARPAGHRSEVSMGSTTRAWDMAPGRRGTGKTGDVFTDRWGCVVLSALLCRRRRPSEGVEETLQLRNIGVGSIS
jgi:hypothetical protein